MDRRLSLRKLEEGALWDIIVIGGGATGLGTAVDAASRGYKTILLEQHDFAKGTSSRSTKLVHGGVRYLQQGNIKLVREALHERGLLLRNAPHLAHNQPFVIPVYTRWGGLFYGIGLKIYDLLAGKLSLGSSKILSREETLRRLPTVASAGLRGGVIYHDGQFDDARLAIHLAQTFSDLGGTPLNYTAVTQLIKSGGELCGARVRDSETGREFEARGRAIVNATGVFTDELMHMDEAGAQPIIALSQGAHLVLEREFLPGDSALMVPHTDDGRVLFAVPWHGKVIVGTTDTPVAKATLEPRALEAEIEFILKHAARYLTRAPRREDVLSVFVGLRPLVKLGGAKKTASISRDHFLHVSPSGLVTITGGKWTTYRKMGEDAVTQAARVGQLAPQLPRTEQLHIHGWKADADTDENMRVYGTDAAGIRSLIAAQSSLGEKLHPRLSSLRAEVVWAVREEMARTVEDVLARRTRALFFDARASIEAAPIVAELLAAELVRDESWKQKQIQNFTALAKEYLLK